MLKSQLSFLTLVAALSAGSVFAAPVSAQDHHDQAEHRVYDTAHKDYHNWDADEDRRYRSFLEERHRSYKDYDHINKKQQREYWQWRHDHDDHR